VNLQEARCDLPCGFKAIFGAAHFSGVVVEDSPEELRELINDFCAGLLEKCKSSDGAFEALSNMEVVRGLLRQGGFKPSGRNRPANEYLLREMMETGRFQFILNLVDINNYLSLKYGLPMSVLDAGRFSGIPLFRLGKANESYVFNPSGQEIDLEKLIVIADEKDAGSGESIPIGSPIKDSMLGKISRQTTSVIGVVYSPAEDQFVEVVETVLREWVLLSQRFAGAKTWDTRVIVV